MLSVIEIEIDSGSSIFRRPIRFSPESPAAPYLGLLPAGVELPTQPRDRLLKGFFIGVAVSTYK